MRAILLCTILVAGCAGSLADPERFSLDADGGAPGCDAPAMVFQAKCASGACHASNGPAAHLDLQSAHAATRLLDVAAAACGGGKLIDSAAPDQSVLLTRLGASSCGGVMPPTGALSSGERTCVQRWVHAAAAGTP